MAATTPPAEFGTPAFAFDLPGIDGRRWTLDDVRGPNGVVVMFICNHCPYVKAIAAKLARDMRELAAEGIGAVAINANDDVAYPEDSFASMKPFAAAHGFTFPYLHDATQAVARAYGAACTPDFFGYGPDLRLAYRGRLDDSGRSPKDGNRRELVEAMREVARTGKPPANQVASIGCSIKWRGE